MGENERSNHQSTPDKAVAFSDNVEEKQGDRKESVVLCPCSNFSAISKITACLKSEEQTNALLEWLEGTTDEIALERHQRVSCGKRSRCRFRIGTSFAILNAIRDACGQFLDDHSTNLDFVANGQGGGGSTPTTSRLNSPQKKQTQAHVVAKQVPYEHAFPSLNGQSPRIANGHSPAPQAAPKVSSNKLVTEIISTKKKKKRIRPQLTTVSASVPSNSVWAKQASPNVSVTFPTGQLSSIRTITKSVHDGATWGNSHGNIAKLALKEPLVVAKRSTTASAATVLPNTLQTSKPHSSAQFISESISPIQSKSGGNSTSRDLFHATEKPQKMPSLDLQQPAVIKTKIATSEQASRLVLVYSALIYNQLVPSTMLEIHLLLRLLLFQKLEHGSNDANTSNETPPGPSFGHIFSTRDSCTEFAKHTLSELLPILRHLNPSMITKLVGCSQFQKELPKVVQVLENTIKLVVSKGHGTNYPVEEITGSHAILPQPFQKDRDSRHNYRSQGEVGVYKNREETRDSFLHQLRAYIDARGKILNPQEGHYAANKIRAESQAILDNLRRANMPWFSEFFCDLLLQIGLAPIEETDEELLTIADKGRLQQLQKRLSTKASHTAKSSKKVVISKKHNASSSLLLPSNEAQQFFPGYQEYFYTFIQETEHYTFCIHLKSRLGALIKDLRVQRPANNQEKHVLSLQLLARFLGFLVFSPNWQASEIGKLKMQPTSSVDTFQQLEAFGLKLDDIILKSWAENSIDGTIPWVSEILKFSKWDSCTQSSRPFRHISSILRSIQLCLSCARKGSEHFLGSGSLITSCYLETLIQDVIGFSQLGSLPHIQLNDISDRSDSLESPRLVGVSNLTVFGSSPHAEDLVTLVENLSAAASQIRCVTSKARKVRPSTVATIVGTSVSPYSLENTERKMDLIGSTFSHDNVESGKPAAMEEKLFDSFFHQHKDLAAICELAVAQVLKNLPESIAATCVLPTFRDCDIGPQSTDFEFEEAERKANFVAQDLLKARLKVCTVQAMKVLGAAELHDKVVEVAASLSTSRGAKKGRPLIDAWVASECANAARKIQKQNATDADENNPNGKLTNDLFQSAVELFRLLDGDPSNSHEDQLRAINDLTLRVSIWAETLDMTIPPEAVLRKLHELIYKLDVVSPLLMTTWAAEATPQIHSSEKLLFAYVLLLSEISTHCRRKMKHFAQMLAGHQPINAVVQRILDRSVDSQDANKIRNFLRLQR